MAGFADKLYRAAPLTLQNIGVSAFGLWWNRQRFGGRFSAERDSFIAREHYSADQWHPYVDRQLRALLALAVRSVPHYQSLGLTSADLLRFTADDLAALPPLEKSIARDAPESLLVNGRRQPGQRIFHTSGSTGTPIATYWLPEELQRSLALREARSCRMASVSYRMPRATFSGRIVEPDPNSRGPFHRFNWFEKQVYFSAFHLRPDTAPQYLQALRDHGIQWMTGYSHSIYQLASFALERKLDAPALKAVITTSEPLTPEMRQTIEQAFSTRVFEEYGAVEDVFYVCECEQGRKHINPDAGIIEIVDERARPVPPGVPGDVLATGFIRPHQPMIRYRIGDQAILDDRPCPCGRAMPVLRDVLGRTEDIIYAPDGRRMVRFHGIFIHQPHVREGQIVQQQLDQIQVRVVVKPGFGPADVADIIHRVQQRLTDQVQVTVVPVERIELNRAGKFQAVVCALSPDEIARFEARS